MNTNQKKFLQRWLIDTFAVLVAANLVTGIQYGSLLSLAGATLVLGLLNATLKPLLLVLSLPLLVVTLGFFWMVINAFLFNLTALLIPGFTVNGFGSAFLGALITSILTLVVQIVVGGGNYKFEYNRSAQHPRSKSRIPSRRSPSRQRPNDDDSGPIIDV